VIALLTVLIYSGISMARVPDWESNETLTLKDVQTIPNSAKTHLFAATTYRKKALLQPGPEQSKNRSLALGHLKQALEIYPEYAEAYGEAAAVLMESKRYDDVIKISERRLQQDSTHYMMQVQKANALFELKRYNDALPIYLNLLKDSLVEPKLVVFNTAAIYFNQRQFAEAIPFFEAFLSYEPNHGYSYFNLGTAYFELEKYEKAFENLSQISPADPSYGLARVNMGHTSLFMEKYEAARDNYLIGLQYFPEDPSVTRNLAIVYMSLGDTVRAQTYFRKVASLELDK
jgi:tetratricopeptide (TPR) repeat protein